mmetsp:Transcript_14102/g.20630  ORF Transcript_14102/g.20630 Transcript_14102/m.20630 type:complete len:245 (+) Transcript_14102:24-758(+)
MDPSGKVQDFKVLQNEILDKVQKVKAKSEQLTSQKNSFMELKNNILLDYCINYAYSIYQSTEETNIEPTEKHMVKLKSLFERLKPIELKLQYQLDKLSQLDFEPELKHKPNPEAFETQTHKNEKPGVYKPPKMQAVEYTEDTKAAKEEERLKKRLAKSTFIEELKEELGDEPVEVRSNTGHKRLLELEKAQQEYEESNFRRLNLSKEEKRYRKKLSRQNPEEENISDFLGLLESTQSPKKKRKH